MLLIKIDYLSVVIYVIGWMCHGTLMDGCYFGRIGSATREVGCHIDFIFVYNWLK